MVPRISALMVLNVFIASMTQTSVSSSTCEPTETNGLDSGLGFGIEGADHRALDGDEAGVGVGRGSWRRSGATRRRPACGRGGGGGDVGNGGLHARRA